MMRASMSLDPRPRPVVPVRPLLLALAALASGCHHSNASHAQGGNGATATPLAVIDGPSGRSARVRLEVARTEAEQSRGLMFRDHLDADAGMLFVFESTADHSFWMKNTYIPLDMIFLDGSGDIVGIVEDAEPQSLEPRSGGESRYVIEVNGGWSAAHGLRPGDHVRLENLPLPPPAPGER